MLNADFRPSSTDVPLEAGHSRCAERYHEGQSRTVEVNGIRIEVRFVGRKGRRARIAIVAPPRGSVSGGRPVTRELHRSMWPKQATSSVFDSYNNFDHFWNGSLRTDGLLQCIIDSR